MKCTACTSDDIAVMTTRSAPDKILRLRRCKACGHRWPTVELDTADVDRMTAAVNAVRTLTTLSRELEDAASTVR